jgi:hypothetical protein
LRQSFLTHSPSGASAACEWLRLQAAGELVDFVLTNRDDTDAEATGRTRAREDGVGCSRASGGDGQRWCCDVWRCCDGYTKKPKPTKHPKDMPRVGVTQGNCWCKGQNIRGIGCVLSKVGGPTAARVRCVAGCGALVMQETEKSTKNCSENQLCLARRVFLA